MKIINGNLFELFKKALPIFCMGLIMIAVMFIVRKPINSLFDEISFSYLLTMTFIGAITYFILTIVLLKPVRSFIINRVPFIG